jgi:hypothetical protein
MKIARAAMNSSTVYPKANHSRLALFLAVYCGLVGGPADFVDRPGTRFWARFALSWQFFKRESAERFLIGQLTSKRTFR